MLHFHEAPENTIDALPGGRVSWSKMRQEEMKTTKERGQEGGNGKIGDEEGRGKVERRGHNEEGRGGEERTEDEEEKRRGGTHVGGPWLIATTLLLACTGSAEGQCNGRPQYLTAGNSSGHVAYPEVNFDPMTGQWQPHQYYPTLVTCTWVLRAPPAHVLEAVFLRFNTEQDYDFVSIYESEARKEQLLRVSGDLTSDWLVTSPGDTLVIDFFSDGFTTYEGFLLAYRYLPRACVEGGVTVTEDHLIALPTVNLRGTLPGPRMEKDRSSALRSEGGHVKVVGKGGAITRPRPTPPELSWELVTQYSPWLNCTWRVAVDSRSLVLMRVWALHTADKDVLTVWEVGAERARPLRRYSGSGEPPFTPLLSSRPLVLTFMAVDGRGGAGFLIDLSYVTRACQPALQEVTAPRGLVAYPRYNLIEGEGTEPHEDMLKMTTRSAELWRSESPAHYGRDSCQWLVKAREGYVLNITFLHLDTHPQDTVQVGDGDDVVLSLSGSQLPRSGYVSKGSEVRVTFNPTQDTQHTGFLMQYSWVLKECGGEVAAGSGEVRSPYYPAHYGPDVTCSWTFTPPPGHLLHLKVTRLLLDQGDALQVRDGVRDVKVRGEGSILSLTPRPSATLYFSSDQHHSRGYFLIKYTSFRPGSCDFTLSPCGWLSTDPKQAWVFHGSKKMMEVSEDVGGGGGGGGGVGGELPRGYRAILTSPWVTTLPDKAPGLTTSSSSSSSSGSSSSSSGEPTCLRFSYLLDGPDAFLLSVWVVEKQVEEGGQLRTTPLIHLYGPHGNQSLAAAVNFTVSADFKVVFQYERGYGPHYRAGVGAVWVGRGRRCGGDVEYLRHATCEFSSHLCGWTNTHHDHRNWLLGTTGVRAEVRGGNHALSGQWADLVSPPLPPSTESDVVVEGEVLGTSGGGGEEQQHSCLKLHYRFLSSNAELRVVLRGLMVSDDVAGVDDSWRPRKKEVEDGVEGGEDGRRHGGGGGGGGLVEKEEEEGMERTLWKQGRVKSPGVLQATVRLPGNLTGHHQVVLRGVGVGDVSAVGVVEVQRVWVGRGEECVSGLDCTLDDGFCSWKMEYTGGAVWYLRPHDDADEGRHAAVQARSKAGDDGVAGGGNGDGDGEKEEEEEEKEEEEAAWLVSETVPAFLSPSSLSFRYKLRGTRYCLWVGQQVEDGKATTLWRQCLGKGDHWLTECVAIPPSPTPYQVVVGAEREVAGGAAAEGDDGSAATASGATMNTGARDGGTAGRRARGASGGRYGATDDTSGGGGEDQMDVWLDDLHFTPDASCDLHLSPPHHAVEDQLDFRPDLDLGDLQPVWECLPQGSLCGLTQPSGAGAPWAYVEAPRTATSTSGATAATASNSIYSANTTSGQYLQCDDGTPVMETWVCDGIPDCPDKSDEAECECEAGAGEGGLVCGGVATPDPHSQSPLCGPHSFHCPSGVWCGGGGCEGGVSPDPCLPREKVCDGMRDCRAGEDEAACSTDSTTHSHDIGEGVVRCSGGLVLPSAWRCDGRKDCPLDGLDELGCGYCGANEFICPRSGVCVPKEQVCDGSPSLPSCTDELHCHTCPPAHLACDVCVASWQICDGVWDCEGGDDERKCLGVGAAEGGDSCPPDSPHRCRSGHCLPDVALCDRRIHCSQGEDEFGCDDDNHDVTTYLSVLGSGGGDDPSILVTPPLPRPPGTVGVLTFLFRLDAWIGPSNLSLSLEEVSAEDPGVGVRAWAVWRQSGHKGTHWLRETVLLPSLSALSSTRLAFLASKGMPGQASPQLHVTRLTYRSVPPHTLQQVGKSRLECEFVESLCGWSQPSAPDGYSWNYARASPHSRRTGPITGYPDGGDSGFLVADSLHGAEGSVADLASPPLLLPQQQHFHQSLCFRLVVFLYGSQVDRVSVLASQHLPPHTHTHTLHTAKGGRGLSWIPVAITVTHQHVKQADLAFVLVIRAVRGRGTEADIAIDHLSLTPGPCNSPILALPDPSLVLQPALYHPHAHAITAGPAFTPLAPAHAHTHHHQQHRIDSGGGSGNGSRDAEVQTPDDPCSGFATCTECLGAPIDDFEGGVGVGVGGCVWCDLSQLCASPDSPAATACPPHLSLPHNTSTGGATAGQWCPQLAPGQQQKVLVAAGGSAVATFPVTNIQAGHTDRGWTCVLERMEWEEGRKEEEEEEGGERQGGAARDEEEEFDFKERRRGEVERRRRRSDSDSVRLPGQFEGQVVQASGGQSVGVGVVKCGEGVGEVWPSPPTHAPTTTSHPHAHYTLTLLTPAAAPLDNTENVTVVVSQCNQLASTCLSCLALNTSCAWCPASMACLPPSLCPSSTWVDVSQGCEAGLGEAGLGEIEMGEVGLGTREPSEPLEDDPLSFHPSIALAPIDDEMVEEQQEDGGRRRRGRKRKGRGRRGEEEEGEEGSASGSSSRPAGRVGGKKRSGKRVTKGKMKVTGRGRAFLRLQQQPGLFVARDAWRLHTGRQYYIPVSRKTLINLGFVRQVTFGSLAQEKARTVLVNGAWKKAAGYFIDLYEKVGQDPVTSLITTSRTVFEQVMAQLSQDQ